MYWQADGRSISYNTVIILGLIGLTFFLTRLIKIRKLKLQNRITERTRADSYRLRRNESQTEFQKLIT